MDQTSWRSPPWGKLSLATCSSSIDKIPNSGWIDNAITFSNWAGGVSDRVKAVD
ncbi:MAG TPA: hypothetical protein VIQ31_38195 [Phormidium sp.]